MARPGRVLRLVLVGVALVAAAVALSSLLDRRPARGLLPDGAALAVEAIDLESLAERLEGTRFEKAFAASATRAWLETTSVVRTLDAARSDIGSAIGITPSRRRILDLLGDQTAVAWYGEPQGGLARSTRWIAVCRPSGSAWALSGALRAAARLGLGGGELTRSESGGGTIVTLGSGPDAAHLFFTRRLLVAGPDRDLVAAAVRVAAGSEAGLTSSESWSRVFARLPDPGSLRVWALDPSWPRPAGERPVRAVGAVVSARDAVVVDLFVDAPGPAPASGDGAEPPPALALQGQAPLLFFSAAGPVPQPVADAILGRVLAVARLERRNSAPAFPRLGHGFALAVTSADDAGLFPKPDGLLAVGMPDAASARSALGLLFPAGARSVPGRWGTAFATRESLPLAGEFELLGASIGSRLVFATRRELLEALEDGGSAASREPGFVPRAAWPFDTVSTLDVTRALPVVRRYAPPLSGLLRARYPGAPDAGRDLALLGSLRSIGVTSGTAEAGTLARITVQVGDLPAAAPAAVPR